MKHGRLVVTIVSISVLFNACSLDPKRIAAMQKNQTKVTSPAKPSRDPDSRPKTYVVAKGDTLYSLSLEYGLDYKDIARWSGIADPGVINVGQVLQLTGPDEVVEVKAITTVRPIEQILPADVLVAQPKALKLPYSETAIADLKRLSQPTNGMVTPRVIADSAPVSVELKSRPEIAKEPKPTPVVPQKPENMASGDDEDLKWVWPTQGKLLSGYSENGIKGLDIGGKKGQAVFSASVGKVVYSGAGLRGYGKLIIVKHNKTYLTAYAHNQAILVKEGDSVSRGQKIAEMGDSDSDVVKLHFEIRRFGKPVDPSKYLPAETKP